MRILVIGGGGREHAIIKKIKENQLAQKIFALPGNGGIAYDAVCVDICATDTENIVKFAKKENIDFAVIAPDDPLVRGVSDALRHENILCFGPTKMAAEIEGSKVFAKNLMKKYSIPTAAYEIFDNADEACRYIDNSPVPLVIKADGLALGKGVFIAQSREEAKEAVKSIMEDKIFGSSGNKIVIEEFLTGPEVSVLAFTDGKTIVPMVSSMDHKRAYDGDTGPNTGGMGAVAPNPFYTPEIAKECIEKIFIPTINAMNMENRSFSGCLYFGLMITKKGPYVIEYNCRFGDPETQAVLPLLKSDLLDIMIHVAKGTLNLADVEFSKDSSCCVVAVSDGYPKKYDTGFELYLPEEEGIFVAGAKRNEDGSLITSGGRVTGVTCTATSLKEAVERAYEKVSRVHFENIFYRRDIGKRALEEIK